MARFAVIGTCCSRDPLIDTEHKVPAFASHVSWASWGTPPIALPENAFDGKAYSPFIRRAVEETFNKSWLDRILSAKFDWLLIDYVMERRVLIKVGDSYLPLHSLVLENPNLKDWRSDKPKLTDAGPLPPTQWEELARPAFEYVKRFVPEDRIIFVRALPGIGFREADGSISPMERDGPNEPQKVVDDLNAIYDATKLLLPWAHQITIDRNLMVAALNHRWGRARYHFERAYEEFVLSEIEKILARA